MDQTGITACEEAEFTALVQRQSRFVFRVAYAVLLNSADAEDAVQETLLKLYRSGDWRQARDERAYLARVAWRTAVDRRRATPRGGIPDSDIPEQASPGQDPETLAVHADHLARLQAMINALPEELRVPLVLAANDELNSREIGAALGIPEGTVRTRLQRARRILRRKLASLEETRYA